jgi:hypothetical protein
MRRVAAFGQAAVELAAVARLAVVAIEAHPRPTCSGRGHATPARLHVFLVVATSATKLRPMPDRTLSRKRWGASASAATAAGAAGGRSPRCTRSHACHKVTGSAGDACSSVCAAVRRSPRWRGVSARRATRSSRLPGGRGKAPRGAPPGTAGRRQSLDEAHHRRGRALATVVSDLGGKRVVELLNDRSRRRIERYLRALSEP